MTSREKKQKPKASAKPPGAPKSEYVPTEREKAALAEFDKRRDAAKPIPKLTLVKKEDDVAKIGMEHEDLIAAAALQMSAFGLTYTAQYDEFLKGALNASMREGGEIDIGEFNGILAMVAAMKPTNAVEAMLTLQMAAVHQASMRLAAMVRKQDTVEALSWKTKTLNNFTRTFGVHAETLQRLRSKPGQQKVTVEHRHYHLAPGAIAPGSQAVLGDVSGGGGQTKTEGQFDERDWMLLPERAAVHGALQANGHALPGAGIAWQEGVPVSRRPSGSA